MFLRFTHAEVTFVTAEHADGGQQRGDAQPEVERQNEYRDAGHQKQAADKLHQRLADELIQLVGVVVDARDQVSGLVFG